jgi:hypothetical protein
MPIGELFKTDDPLLSSTTGVFTNTFGSKVWDTLNNKITTYNLIRHVPYGPDVGWRLRTARGASSAPVGENAAIPDSDKQTRAEIYSLPRYVVSHGEVTLQAQFLATTKDGIGNAIADEHEFAELDHAKEINQEILLSSCVECDTAVSNTTISLYTGGGGEFRVGDVIAVVDDDSINTGTISAISTDTLTTDTTATGDQYAVVCVHSRAGITSLDDIVHKKIAAAGTTDMSHGVGWPDVDVHSVDRSAGTTADCASLQVNTGTVRELTLDLVDACIRAIRENGGEPDLIVTGYDMVDKLAQQLRMQNRYMGAGTFQVKQAGEETLQGHQVGFDVATYRGIPVFPDADVFKLNVDGVEKGSNVYVLDTNFLEIAVAVKTTYQERDDFITAAKLNYDFLLYTGLELRCYNYNKQAKITDLDAV